MGKWHHDHGLSTPDTSNVGDIPAEGLTIDASAVPECTDGEHVVQNFGNAVVINGETIQPFFEYSRCKLPSACAHLSLLIPQAVAPRRRC